MALGCFALIFSVRLQLVATAGFAHPYWDQWSFEATTIVQPFLEGRLRFADLFTAESEHRNVLPRLTQLALVGVDGRFWDCLAQTVMNVGLFALFGTLVLSQLFRLTKGFERWLLLALLLLVFCSPIGFQNTLWGICSSWYFLIFCSLLAIVAISKSSPFSLGWFVGLIAAVASFFGMAGGVVTPVVCAGITFVRWLQLRKDSKTHLLAIFIWLALAVGLFAATPRVPGNQLASATAAEFLNALLGTLAFPFSLKVFGIPTLLILAGLGIALLHPGSRARWTRGDFAVLGSLLWLLGQSVALAYGRGRGGIPHRYHELLALFGPFTLASLASLPRLLGARRTATLSCHVILAGLLAAYLVGLTRLTIEALTIWVPSRSAVFAVQESNLRSLVRTNDVDAFRGLTADQAGSYQGADVISGILRTPSVRAALAPSIREPLSVTDAGTGVPLSEPFPADRLNTIILPAPRAGRHYSIMVETLFRPTIRDRLDALWHGMIWRPTPRSDNSHSVEIITTDPRRLQETKALASLKPVSLFLPRELGPIGSAMRFLLSFSPLLVVIGLFGFTAAALRLVYIPKPRSEVLCRD
jgi:hypothetical protein